MITDPFVVEKILLDNYGDIGKWYRYESHGGHEPNMDITFTYADIDGNFAKMNVNIIYDKSDVEYLQNRMRDQTMTSYFNQRYREVEGGIISLYGEPPGMLDTISIYIKQYDRDSKIDSLLNE
jgi:hypothetical protein